MQHGAIVSTAFKYRYTEDNAYEEVDETALHLAAERGDERIVDLLLSCNADPLAINAQKETPLEIASRENHPGVLRLLLKHLENVRSDAWEGMLADAVQKARTPLVEVLLSGNQKLSHVSDRGRSLIASALKRRKTKNLVDMLITHGANIDAPDVEGNTLLHDGVNVGPRRMKRLLKRGANIEAQDNKGQTPLHHAACAYVDVVRVLLEHGADTKARDKEGWTPLHLAAGGVADAIHNVTVSLVVQIGDGASEETTTVAEDDGRSISADIAELLIEHGAEVNAVAEDGTTPLDLAANQAIAAVLQKHGGFRRAK